MPRLLKEDWLKAGLAVLHDAGHESMTIDMLCTRLSISKGSFYHHFSNRDNFIVQLLKYWEVINTQQIIEMAEQASAPTEKLAMLNALTRGTRIDPEIPIRAWAVRDNMVREYVARVDQQRLDYIRQLVIDLGLPEKTATLTAQLSYAVFIGRQHMIPPILDEEAEHLEVYMAELLGIQFDTTTNEGEDS